MVLGELDEEMGFEGEDGKNRKNAEGGFTIGGDMGFYEWNFEVNSIPKDTQ